MSKLGSYVDTYIKGKVPKKLLTEQVSGSLPYITPDFLRNKADVDFFAVPDKSTVVVQDNDVIVLWDGSNAGEIFSARKGILSSTMVKLKISEDRIDKRYFFHSCKNIEYVLKAKTAGSGIPHADKGVVKGLEIFIPEDILEQKAIAGILSKVDKAIEVVENNIKASVRLKKSLMQNLLSGKLKSDGTWRSEDEFYMDEKFGKVPKGWHIVKGNKITTKITKGQSPKWQGFNYQPSGILFVTSENVRDGYIDISEPKFLPIEFHEKIKNSQLQNGDVLINIVGASIGRCAVYDLNTELANTNQAVCVLRINDDNDSKFISYYLQSEKTQRRLLGSQVETARANLSLSDFRKFKFIIPETKQEQLLIAEQIEKVNSHIVSKQSKKRSLKTLKKSLMRNLLTGKVRLDLEKIDKILEEV